MKLEVINNMIEERIKKIIEKFPCVKRYEMNYFFRNGKTLYAITLCVNPNEILIDYLVNSGKVENLIKREFEGIDDEVQIIIKDVYY